METPLLAAVIIVKDEEAHLSACLDSLDALRPLLDEVVVYDTGSSDATRDIARAGGARVVEGYWDQDFSRARNDATAHARAKWVLSVDADERVDADQHRLRELLRRGLTHGLTGWDVVNTMIVDFDEAGEALARHPFCKLFRPTRAHWVSPLHEVLAARRHGRDLVVVEAPESVVRLRHYGYAERHRRLAKASRNAAVAHAGLERGDLTPDRFAKLATDEARAQHASGLDEQAGARYRQAWEIPGLSRETRLVVAQDYIPFLIGSGAHDEAGRLLALARSAGADPDLLAWFEAQLLMATGRPAEALPLLRGLRSLKLSSTLELDGSIAVATLMSAAIQAGEFDEALACAIQLVASTGDTARYGAQLLRLWGDQDPVLLARLLAETAGPRLSRVTAGLRDLGPVGAAVAGHLVREEGPARRVGASAFGI